MVRREEKTERKVSIVSSFFFKAQTKRRVASLKESIFLEIDNMQINSHCWVPLKLIYKISRRRESAHGACLADPCVVFH